MNLRYILIFQLVAFANAATSEFYKGAVVEFSPAINNIKANTALFVENIQNAAKEKADIIVFPEMALNGYGLCTEEMLTEVPHPSEKLIPCENVNRNFSTSFQSLSCAARDNAIYVVVNIAEVVSCPTENCSPKGYLKYNTNVVFDRSGTVIARYRKYHLFGEAGTDITRDPQLVFFDTDFGVRFGTFICFDLMFSEPAVQLIRQLEIKDIVFSTAWFSELPFLTALQAQSMWAYAMDVNFLGAGYNDPEVGSGGSGIYQGRAGPLTMTFPESPSTKLLLADVPIKPSFRRTIKEPRIPSQSSDVATPTLYLKQDNLTLMETTILKDGNTTLCHNEFCCQFQTEFILRDESTSYRSIAFDGVRSFDSVATGGIQICAVIACVNDTLSGCGFRTNSEHDFHKIRISGQFDAKASLQMPSTLRQGSELLGPLSSDEFNFVSSCDTRKCNVTMETSKTLSNVLSFGIYGRVFSRDGELVTAAGVSRITIIQLTFLLPLIISKLV